MVMLIAVVQGMLKMSVLPSATRLEPHMSIVPYITVIPHHSPLSIFTVQFPWAVCIIKLDAAFHKP